MSQPPGIGKIQNQKDRKHNWKNDTLSLKEKKSQKLDVKGRDGEKNLVIEAMHSEATQMCGCRTAGRTLRSRKEKEVPPDSKTAEQDGVALRNSAWGRQTG